jgi:hypothetical protein
MILTSLVADAGELAAAPAGPPSRRACARARSAFRRPAASATTVRSTSRSWRNACACRWYTTRSGLWALGPPAGGTALASAVAADPELMDRDGNPFRLSSLHGRKVLLVAWASW